MFNETDGSTQTMMDSRGSPQTVTSGTENLFFVIPAFNEARNVRQVVENAAALFPDANVVVVDDGSSDGTAAEADRGGAIVLRLPFNCGYGVALQTGLLYALRCGATVTVSFDADGQHEVSDIRKLIAPLKSDAADLTIGSRYLAGSRSYRIPLSRRWPQRALSILVSLLMGRRIYDTTTGFQAMNGKALRSYMTMRDFPEATPDADLLLYAHMNGCRVLEVPVTMYEDKTGDSMHSLFKSFFYIPKMLVSLLGVLLAYKEFRK